MLTELSIDLEQTTRQLDIRWCSRQKSYLTNAHALKIHYHIVSQCRPRLLLSSLPSENSIKLLATSRDFANPLPLMTKLDSCHEP